MEFISIPELGIISAVDFNQRYSGTYIHYKNEIVFCKEAVIHRKLNAKLFSIVLEGKKQVTIEDFDWEKLNTYRFPAQWFIARNGKAIYFYLKNDKQYKRGYCTANCGWWPAQLHSKLSLLNLLEDLCQKEPKKIKIDAAAIDLNKHYVLSNKIAILDGKIYFKTNEVGKIDAKTREVSLIHSFFTDEIKEVIVSPQPL